MDSFVRGLPKAELHLHIEGTLEPELAFRLAERNGVELSFPSVEALRAAYEFDDLQSFLDVYYEVAEVLQTGQDFHDLTIAYLERAHGDGVRRAEIFFDPQTHTERGIDIGVVIGGITSAFEEAFDRFGMSCGLILCFLRHLPVERAMATLQAALPYREQLLGVGLDSSEVGHPPELFAEVFAKARAEGFRIVAHAGEEAPPSYVWGAINDLEAERIDHGVRAIEDPALVDRIVGDEIPLTMCPLSNVKLRVFERLEDHNLKQLLDRGVRVTINSDDPAYFGGYIGDNYLATQQALGLSDSDMVTIARNSLEASFLNGSSRNRLLGELDAFVVEHGLTDGG